MNDDIITCPDCKGKGVIKIEIRCGRCQGSGLIIINKEKDDDRE